MTKFLNLLFLTLALVAGSAYAVHKIHLTIVNNSFPGTGTLTYMVYATQGTSSAQTGNLAPGEKTTLTLAQKKVGAYIKGSIDVFNKDPQSMHFCKIQYKRHPASGNCRYFGGKFTCKNRGSSRTSIPNKCLGFYDVSSQKMNSSSPIIYFKITK